MEDRALQALQAALTILGALGVIVILPSWAYPTHALFFWIVLACETVGALLLARRLLRFRILIQRPKLRVAVASALAVWVIICINIVLNLAWYMAHDGT